MAFSKETWNIVFYNIRTDERYLLFNSIVPIINEYPTESDLEYVEGYGFDTITCEKRKNDKLFYEITVCDYNNNGQIDGKDPNYLFMSDLDGRNLEQISPDSIDLKKWKFIDNKMTLIEIDGKIDSDNDKEFDGSDREFIYLIDLENMNNNQSAIYQSPITKIKPNRTTPASCQIFWFLHRRFRDTAMIN